MEPSWTSLFREKTNRVTVADIISATLSINDWTEASQFFASYAWWIAENYPGSNAAETARANIGWCFGEGMSPVQRRMWYIVADVRHPFFGTMDPPPSPEEAFQAGLDYGERMKNGDTSVPYPAETSAETSPVRRGRLDPIWDD